MFVYIVQNREMPLSKHVGLKKYGNQRIMFKCSIMNSVISSVLPWWYMQFFAAIVLHFEYMPGVTK